MSGSFLIAGISIDAEVLNEKTVRQRIVGVKNLTLAGINHSGRFLVDEWQAVAMQKIANLSLRAGLITWSAVDLETQIEIYFRDIASNSAICLPSNANSICSCRRMSSISFSASCSCSIALVIQSAASRPFLACRELQALLIH